MYSQNNSPVGKFPADPLILLDELDRVKKQELMTEVNMRKITEYNIYLKKQIQSLCMKYGERYPSEFIPEDINQGLSNYHNLGATLKKQVNIPQPGMSLAPSSEGYCASQQQQLCQFHSQKINTVHLKNLFKPKKIEEVLHRSNEQDEQDFMNYCKTLPVNDKKPSKRLVPPLYRQKGQKKSTLGDEKMLAQGPRT